MDIQFKPIANGFLAHYKKESLILSAHFHYHDAYELYYCIDGVRNYLTRNKVYPLESDWITLTKPFLVHGTNGQHYERILLSFSDSFLQQYFSPTMIELFQKVFAVEAIPASLAKQHPRIKELFYLTFQSSNEKNMNMAAIYLGELLLILYDLVQHVPTETNTSNLSIQMQEILSYVSNNLASIKNLEQVASHFYLSKYYLSHQFKNSTGFTFIEFLTKAKISRALHLLKNTSDSVAMISAACGFETPAYFCIVFKKKMHMTPLQYRTWITEKNESSNNR